MNRKSLRVGCGGAEPATTEANAPAAKILRTDANTISLEGIKLLTLQDNQRLFAKGDDLASLYFTAQIYSDFYLKKGTINSEPNFFELLDNPFVQKK